VLPCPRKVSYIVGDRLGSIDTVKMARLTGVPLVLSLMRRGRQGGITCSTHLRGGVALTDTQKSEYWTMPIHNFSAWNSSTCSLPLTRIYIHPWTPVVQSKHSIRHRNLESSSVRGLETYTTCATTFDRGTCEDAALFWSSRDPAHCDHESASSSPSAAHARLSAPDPPRSITASLPSDNGRGWAGSR